MAITPPRRNVAMFIDLENLFGGYGRDVTAVPLAKLVAGIDGTLRTGGLGSGRAVTKAYANWSHPDMNAYRPAVQAGGIEPVQVFAFGSAVKNAADIELCVDALGVAHDSPWVEVFVLVTGDGGFVPLVRRLHALGKHVVVVSGSHPDAGIANRYLAGLADGYYVLGSDGTVVASAAPASAQQQAASPWEARTPPTPGPSAGPTLEDYKAAVKRIVTGTPGILVDGKVQGSRLGSQLRQRWPGTSYKDFGTASLGSFLEKHCALQIHRPHQPTGS